MALIFADRVKETTTSTGTGPLTLAGAVAGFEPFSSVCADGDTAYYCVTDGTSWEVGLGTYAAGVLTRTSVLSSSNAGAAVALNPGSKDVFLTVPAQAVGDLVLGLQPQVNQHAIAISGILGGQTNVWTATSYGAGSIVLGDTTIGNPPGLFVSLTSAAPSDVPGIATSVWRPIDLPLFAQLAIYAAPGAPSVPNLWDGQTYYDTSTTPPHGYISVGGSWVSLI